MTIEQARKIVGQQMGFPATFDGSILAYQSLSAAQQVELTKNLLAYIKANPANFTAQQVNTANVQYSQAQTFQIQDTSFDWEEWADEIQTNALTIGNSVASVGTGITQSVSLVGTLLPVAVLFVLGVFAYSFLKSKTE